MVRFFVRCEAYFPTLSYLGPRPCDGFSIISPIVSCLSIYWMDLDQFSFSTLMMDDIFILFYNVNVWFRQSLLHCWNRHFTTQLLEVKVFLIFHCPVLLSLNSLRTYKLRGTLLFNVITTLLNWLFVYDFYFRNYLSLYKKSLGNVYYSFNNGWSYFILLRVRLEITDCNP